MPTPTLMSTSRNREKDHSHPPHLSGHVGEADEERGDHRNQARRVGGIAVADEIRDGEVTELPQIGSQQERQQHVAAGPAHQIHPAGVAHEADQPGHGDEGGGAHPVGRGGHTVGRRRNTSSGHIEALGVPHPAHPGDEQVQTEAQPHKQEGPGANGHCFSSRPLCLQAHHLGVVLGVEPVEQQRVDQDQDHEDDDGPLLGKPETPGDSPQAVGVESIGKEDPATQAGNRPNDQEHHHDLQVGAPVALLGFLKGRAGRWGPGLGRVRPPAVSGET